jgi:pSer/pThr/pTyr-binding forkhead associated (FHA) protein/tetratricopeptide (TPR) repeat protein
MGLQTMAVLIFRTGPRDEKRFPLVKEVSSIGRDEDCDVVLPDASVSRRHAFVYRVDERLYRVEDHNSSNGTLVNGEAIVTEFLSDGDRLEIGCYELLFRNALTAEPAFPPDVDEQLPEAAPPAPEGVARPATLLVLEAGKVVKEHAFTGDVLTVGSGRQCGLIVVDPRVAPEHAQIVHHDGIYFLEDLESPNGTFCNQERIISTELKSGDEISIGRHVLVFEVDDDLPLPAEPERRPAEQARAAATSESAPAPAPAAAVPGPRTNEPADLRSAKRVRPAPRAAPKRQAPTPEPVAAPAPDAPVVVVPRGARAPVMRVRQLSETIVETPQGLEPALPAVRGQAGPPAARPAAPPEGRRPRLLITLPGGRRKEATIDKDEMTLGRLPSNDIVLDDDSISRVHARLFYQAGSVRIKDQESLNGVQVAGQFVDEAELHNGDLLALGEIRMELRDEAAPAPARTAARRTDGHAETIYDDVPEPAAGPREAETLYDEIDEAPRPARAPQRKLREAETLYEEGAALGLDEPVAGPIDRFRDLYRKLGPTQRQRRLRAVLVGLIVLALLALLFAEPSSQEAPRPAPAPPGRAAPDSGVRVSADDAERLARLHRVQQGQQAMESQDWAGALELLEPVLADEPGHVQALGLRETARGEQEILGALERARELAIAGQHEQAAELLRSVPPQSVYYSLAEARRKDAEGKLAEAWIAEAARLKDQRKVDEALVLARRALELVPESPAALRLERELARRQAQPERSEPAAEERLRARRDDEQRRTRAREEAQQLVSRALASYAAGDAEAAITELGRAGAGSDLPAQDEALILARTVAERVRAAKHHYEAARSATAQGQHDVALIEWKELLVADRAVLGNGRSSRYRQEAAAPMAEALTQRADALYETGKGSGNLAAAYSAYRDALGHAPSHAPALKGAQLIEKEAVERYQQAYGRWEGDPKGALEHLDAVLRMLPPDHEYAKRAGSLRSKIQSRGR